MFSKYDVYTECGSKYYYKDADVLINKLKIKSAKSLKEAENDMSFVKALELNYNPIQGYFSVNHLCKIHRFLFEDIYYFAGRFRYEDISKGSTKFLSFNEIPQKLSELLNKLNNEKHLKNLNENDFYNKLAYYMAELNYIHPFREGNGRTIREFIRELSLYNGYEMDWDKVEKERLLDASINSIFDISLLIQCLKECCNKTSD